MAIVVKNQCNGSLVCTQKENFCLDFAYFSPLLAMFSPILRHFCHIFVKILAIF
jgi:hypothetical protein